MNVNREQPQRILVFAHAFPTPTHKRLWRWVEAAQSAGEVWLIAPAGPSMHLAHWHELASRVRRLELLPGTPFHRGIRFRRAIADAMEDVPFDVVLCTSPGLTSLVQPSPRATHLVDALSVMATPSALGLGLSVATTAVVAPPWRPVPPELDPMQALHEGEPPQALAA